jgi:hypothetical protein
MTAPRSSVVTRKCRAKIGLGSVIVVMVRRSSDLLRSKDGDPSEILRTGDVSLLSLNTVHKPWSSMETKKILGNPLVSPLSEETRRWVQHTSNSSTLLPRTEKEKSPRNS